MAGKIFINYRRDDERAMAARMRDRLAGAFGPSSVFMDVDNLLAGQRFDRELEKALAQTDVFLAVIGARWMESLKSRIETDERDYVREEIAAALKRGTLVIPVLIEKAALPRRGELPDEIQELVLHQKHDVTHERFGRDVEDLVGAIRAGRKAARAGSGSKMRIVSWGAVSTGLAVLVLAGTVLVFQLDVSMLGSSSGDAGTKTLAMPAGKGNGKQDHNAGVEVKKQPVAAAASSKASPPTALSPPEPAVGIALAPSTVGKSDGIEALVGNHKRFLKPKDTFKDCTDCPEMVVVSAGQYRIGTSSPTSGPYGQDEFPVRLVIFRRPFAVGKFELTFAEWDACAKDRACPSVRDDKGWGRGNQPVIHISWNDAKQYIHWLTQKTNKPYRLLSEAEWEYAALAEVRSSYSWGDSFPTGRANCYDCGSLWDNKQPAPVGSFRANAFGLHDMHGNVAEWVNDCYRNSYTEIPADGSSVRETVGCPRVVRGGAWNNFNVMLRATTRTQQGQELRLPTIGTRVARTLD